VARTPTESNKEPAAHAQPAPHPATTAHAQPAPRPAKEAPKAEEGPRK
jgi:hypothetical protein